MIVERKKKSQLIKYIEVDGRNYIIAGCWNDKTPDDYDFYDVCDLSGMCLNEGKPFYDEPTEEEIRKLVSDRN